MLQVTNLAQVNGGLDRWLEAAEETANAAFRGYAARVFKYILEGTPQWSGNLVATWRVTVGQPAVGYLPTAFKAESDLGGVLTNAEPFSRQSPNGEAVRYALSIAREALAQVRLGAPIFITNTAPYAENVEENRNEKGEAFLRVVNLPVEMVHAAEVKFGNLGVLKEADAFALAREAL